MTAATPMATARAVNSDRNRRDHTFTTTRERKLTRLAPHPAASPSRDLPASSLPAPAPVRPRTVQVGALPSDLPAQASAGASASSRPWARVFHDRVAHLMRTGNFTTPRSASRSPSFTSASTRLVGVVGRPSPSSAALVDRHHRLERPGRGRATSSTVLPLTAADIIDADDWLIEQPWPSMRMSATLPSVDVEVDDDLVAAQRVEPLDPVRRRRRRAHRGSAGCGSGRG